MHSTHRAIWLLVPDPFLKESGLHHMFDRLATYTEEDRLFKKAGLLSLQ